MPANRKNAANAYPFDSDIVTPERSQKVPQSAPRVSVVATDMVVAIMDVKIIRGDVVSLPMKITYGIKKCDEICQ
jgi:hypothetical protein